LKHRSHYWQLLPYLQPQIGTIAKALICTVIFTLFWPILAFLAGRVASHLAQGQVEAMVHDCGWVAGGFLVHKLAQYGQDSLMAKAALAIALELRKDVYRHLQTVHLGYFATAKTGDLTYRLTEEVDRVGEVIKKFFHDTTPCVLQLVGVLGYMIYINWQLTLATFIAAPLIGLLTGWFGEQLLKFSRRSQSQISDLSAILTEVFSGIRLVRAFAAEDYEIERFATVAEGNRRSQYSAAWLQSIQHPVVGFLQMVSILLLLVLGTWQIAQGNLTGASFTSYVAAVAMLIDPIGHLTENYNLFKQTEASVDRVFELLEIEPGVVELADAYPLPMVQGQVDYQDVSFAYESAPDADANPWVLQGLNLSVKPGEAVALVGASGAGKSTIMNLLPRFYDPQRGQILIDGLDIRNVTLASLRRQIGIVPQETILFSGSIAQNIAFGQRDIDWQAVEEAAKVANAHQFISQLPEGYRTWVGERGVNLSGGQRQRLAIARAVLLNPHILILDEATSALDSESEALVQEALERLMENRTVFIIAHRLATVRRADRILVLEKGEVVESGTHQQLLVQGGRYAGYYAQQFS
jgi:ATP-binding cassette subfamily B protein